MSVLYAIDAPNYHKLPLKRDVYLINRKWLKYTCVIKSCTDLYHTKEWDVVQKNEVTHEYKEVNARFDDGELFLD
jgi:hypothetical protein